MILRWVENDFFFRLSPAGDYLNIFNRYLSVISAECDSKVLNSGIYQRFINTLAGKGQ